MRWRRSSSRAWAGDSFIRSQPYVACSRQAQSALLTRILHINLRWPFLYLLSICRQAIFLVHFGNFLSNFWHLADPCVVKFLPIGRTWRSRVWGALACLYKGVFHFGLLVLRSACVHPRILLVAFCRMCWSISVSSYRQSIQMCQGIIICLHCL